MEKIIADKFKSLGISENAGIAVGYNLHKRIAKLDSKIYNVYVLKVARTLNEALSYGLAKNVGVMSPHKRISYEDMLYKSPVDLAPELFTRELEEISARSKIEVKYKTIDMDCRVCGHNKGYYRFVQTRAADEMQTTVLICERCGKTRTY